VSCVSTGAAGTIAGVTGLGAGVGARVTGIEKTSRR